MEEVTTIKLGFISDLHVDMNKKYKISDYLNQLNCIMDDKQLEGLIVGGDIANHYHLTIEFIEKLQKQSNRPIRFVPGNHDYWQMDERVKETQKIYEMFRQHPQCLVNAPWLLNSDLAIVGHSAWYNHAYHGPQFNDEQLERGQYKLATWQDKKHLDWQDADKIISKFFAAEAEADIIKCPGKEIILVTHMVTIKDYCVPMPHPAFDFFNAFIATNDFDAIYKHYPITASFMGHVHFRHQKQKDGVHYVVNSLGYFKEWHQQDLYAELNAALYLLDI